MFLFVYVPQISSKKCLTPLNMYLNTFYYSLSASQPVLSLDFHLNFFFLPKLYFSAGNQATHSSEKKLTTSWAFKSHNTFEGSFEPLQRQNRSIDRDCELTENLYNWKATFLFHLLGPQKHLKLATKLMHI